MPTKKIQILGGFTSKTDATLTQEGVPADAKTVGDALAAKQPVGNYALADDVAQKTQVQIITWEADD